MVVCVLSWWRVKVVPSHLMGTYFLIVQPLLARNRVYTLQQE